jgi:N utilization substance protein B
MLRVKALQSLYSYYQGQAANVELGADLIAEIFSPDLNSMEVQDHVKLKAQREEATIIYKKAAESGNSPDFGTSDKIIANAVYKALDHFKSLMEKDRKQVRKHLQEDIQKLSWDYLMLLKFLLDVSEQVMIDEQENMSKLLSPKSSPPKYLKLHTNKIIEKLRINESFLNRCGREHVGWEKQVIRSFFKEILKKDDEYIRYQELKEASWDDDRAILMHIMKDLMLKKESVIMHLEESDLNWNENSVIAKGVASKALKLFDESYQEKSPLPEIALNWDEDREFYMDLFEETLKRDKELEGYVMSKIKNWEMDRLAMTDRILLKLAAAEMIRFPSIPVKVTINEFIEISKSYSTPNSKQFVNGILDALSAELSSQGIVKKSGRGLIDNK